MFVSLVALQLLEGELGGKGGDEGPEKDHESGKGQGGQGAWAWLRGQSGAWWLTAISCLVEGCLSLVGSVQNHEFIDINPISDGEGGARRVVKYSYATLGPRPPGGNT